MSNMTKSKAMARARAIGLNIRTDFTPRSNVATSTMIASARPAKQVFELTSTPDKISTPKTSEALANPDWRNLRRPRADSQDNVEPCPTAPPAKFGFSKQDIAQSRSKRRFEAIGEERASAYGLRQYRDTLVDADFILSAPATKTEFDHALKESETEARDNSSNEVGGRFHGDRGLLNPTNDHIMTKDFVRLEAMTPKTRTGFENILNWGEPYEKRVKETERAISAFPWAPLEVKEENFNIEFPLAEIHAVKGAQRFQPDSWAHLDRRMHKLFEYLIEPRSAGLPVDKLRAKYNETQRVLSLVPRLDDYHNSVLGNANKQGVELRSNNHLARAYQEENRFHALLGKLQKSIDTRSRIHERKIGDAHQSRSNDTEKEELSKEQANKTPTLNPNAAEFRSVKTEQQPPVSVEVPFMLPPPRTNSHRPERLATSTELLELRGLLMTELREIRERIHNPMMAQPGIDAHHGFEPQTYEASNHIYGTVHPSLPVADPWSALNPASAFNPGIGPAPTIQYGPQQTYVEPPYFAAPGSMEPQSMTPASNAHQSNMYQPRYHGPRRAPRNGYTSNQYNNIAPPMPPSANAWPHGQQGGLTLGPHPHHGPSSGPMGVPNGPTRNARGRAQFYGPPPFGPMPVRRPRAPGNSAQQQAYEAYLEFRRQTDPEYAMQCKERQNNRMMANRERPNTTD